MVFPIKPSALDIQGALGVALHMHIVSSTYLGPDAFGHDRFENVRSEIGEALFQLKYKNDQSKVAEIAATAWLFLQKRPTTLALLERIIAVPPSNRERPYQPVELVARELSKLSGVQMSDGDLIKCKQTPQLKDLKSRDEKMELLNDAFDIQTDNLEDRHVLLLDDLYASGTTAACIVDTLFKKGRVASVRVLALTRTRSRK